MRQKTLWSMLGIIAALLSAGIGIVFLSTQQNQSTGAVLLVLAGIVFVICYKALENYQITEDENLLIRKNFIPAAAWILAAILVLAVLASLGKSPSRPAAENHNNAALWIIAMFVPVIILIWRNNSFVGIKSRLRAWLSTNRNEIVALAVLLFLGLLIRSYDLPFHPYPWSGDEASVGIEGRRILQGEVTDFFTTGWSGQPNWSFVPTTLALMIWSNTITAVRMPSVLIGVLSILTTYLLAREMFNGKVGLLAAGFLLAFPYHVHFSRIGVNNIVDSFIVTLTLWLMVRAARRKTMLSFVIAGLISGLTFYTYVGSRLVLALAFGTGAIVFLNDRSFLKEEFRNILAYFGALILSIAPIGFYFYNHPDQFMTRIGQENILSNGWLASEATKLSVSQAELIFTQFSKTILVFIASGAPGNFFNSPQPYLTLFGAVLAIAGLSISIAGIRKSSNAVLQLWFWAVIILGGMLTTSPPANTRLVMTIPAVAIFIALGINAILQVVKQLNLITSPSREWLLASVLLGVLLIQNTTFYFVEYRNNFYFNDASAELAMESGQILSELGPQYGYYLLGAPRVYAGFPTTPFLAPNNFRTDLPVIDGQKSPEINFWRGAFFVAIPENQAALEEIMRQYPGGKPLSFERLAKQEILFYAYILSAEQMQAFAPQE